MFLWYFNTERVIHSVKTALACLIGFAITKALHFYVDQWLIISIIVVMCAQISVGSVIKKSYMRFVGTLSGSLLALATLLLFGQNEIAFAIMITIAALLFSYIATGEQRYNEAGTLGAVTVVIILINHQPTPMIALDRFLEISLGILIAALISQFILPIHARKHLRETQAITMRKLRLFYLAMLATEKSDDEQERYQKLDEEIALSLIKQRKLAADSVNEPLGRKFESFNFKSLLQAEKEILRCISAMHNVYRASIDFQTFFLDTSMLPEYHHLITLSFEKIADFIQNKKEQELLIDLPNMEILKEDFLLRGINIPKAEFIYIDVFLFSAEILVVQIQKVVRLVSDIKK